MAKIIPVASGKGGVGKTTFVANLGVLLAERGKTVIVIDLDLGGSNLHTYLGVKNTGVGVGEYIKKPREISFESLIFPTRYAHLYLIAGDALYIGVANLSYPIRKKIIAQIENLVADYILVDLGSGTNSYILDFFLMTYSGGDGTQAGALAIAEEAEKRGYTLSVVGVPKTVDNDLSYVQQSFGFATAVEKAVQCVSGAHAEAKAAYNGIGIVKVMGRYSGFIAAHTALASTDVNFCLIPEVPFDLEGEKGLLRALEKRLVDKQHLVIMVAEGAGQELMEHRIQEKDASGNVMLQDIAILYVAHLLTLLIAFIARVWELMLCMQPWLVEQKF
ncbi:UNVERIFIED_CONTAM: hypothetical protein PYX00_011050 [Menopon gallinae]|uniref:Phosphofructokinase domain-containing protein n=1 Tax=Menopon gallinae TaxID=328185 RepID=A0AAW2H6T3_9NEOP